MCKRPFLSKQYAELEEDWLKLQITPDKNIPSNFQTHIIQLIKVIFYLKKNFTRLINIPSYSAIQI